MKFRPCWCALCGAWALVRCPFDTSTVFDHAGESGVIPDAVHGCVDVGNERRRRPMSPVLVLAFVAATPEPRKRQSIQEPATVRSNKAQESTDIQSGLRTGTPAASDFNLSAWRKSGLSRSEDETLPRQTHGHANHATGEPTNAQSGSMQVQILPRSSSCPFKASRATSARKAGGVNPA